MSTPDHIALGPTVGLDAIRADEQAAVNRELASITAALASLRLGIRAALDTLAQDGAAA